MSSITVLADADHPVGGLPLTILDSLGAQSPVCDQGDRPPEHDPCGK
jgi:hypothetical protein